MAGPWEKYQQMKLPPASPIGPFPGMLQQGNIDLAQRPIVRNADGSYSTVRSMSFGTDNGETLVPTVSPDGKIMSDQQAMDLYGRTGQNLGQFDTSAHADMYAEALHKAQEQHYGAQQAQQQAQQQASDGPWAKYAQAPSPAVPASPDPQTPGSLMDAVSSFAAGAGRGAADLVGMPGTIGDALKSGGQWALRNGYETITGNKARPGTFFGGPTPEMEAMMIGGGSNPLGGANLKSALSKVTSGATDYQPHTIPGEYARTIGEFTPAALAFGGMNPASFVTNAAVPAAASETAGQVTKDTMLEPYARLAGAVVGGIGANKLFQPAAEALPTAASIKASAGYKDLKAPMQAAQIDQPAYKSIVSQLDNVAQDFGMVPEQHGGFQTILLRHAQNADKGGASLQDLEILRRSLANAGNSPTNPSAGELSRQMISKLDETVNGLSGGNVVNQAGQTADETLAALQDARSIYRTGVKSNIIEQAIEKAKNAASGYENGLRNQFRSLLNNKEFQGTFSPAERLAMQQVVRGTAKGNALRFLGGFGVPLDNGRNFLGSVMGGGVGSTLGAAVAGPVGAAVGGPALIAAGTLAKQAASNLTDKSAQLTEALVKAGPDASRLFSEALAASKGAGREAILRALLQSQSAVQAPSSRELVR